MLAFIEKTRPGATDCLHDDAISELQSWTDLQLRPVPDNATQTRCSVAGGYVHTTTPPTLTITESLSPGRRQFTALHELGHHLQKQSAALALAVRRQLADNEEFEDAACDMFASLVLIPDDILTQVPDGRSPSARDIVDLFERTRASRAACCVRVADLLNTPGAVVLMDGEGVVSFAAGHGEVYPPARGSSQAATPLVAAALGGRDARVDDTFIEYRSGNRSRSLYGDAAWCDGYLITVNVVDRAGWKQFAPPREDRTGLSSWRQKCATCETEFTVSQPCPRCEIARCPHGHCGCAPAGSRRCEKCFLEIGPGGFATPSATICKECAS